MSYAMFTYTLNCFSTWNIITGIYQKKRWLYWIKNSTILILCEYNIQINLWFIIHSKGFQHWTPNFMMVNLNMNMTQSKITWEQSPSEELSRQVWPLNTSMCDFVTWVNWSTRALSGFKQIIFWTGFGLNMLEGAR